MTTEHNEQQKYVRGELGAQPAAAQEAGQRLSELLCSLAESGQVTLDPFDSNSIDAIVAAVLGAAPVTAAPIGSDACPVTGLRFYDNMEHPERGMIAMYGGPFDVYSIPELGDDDELRRERYDLDRGDWVEGGEPLGYFYREQQLEEGSTPAAPGIDLEQLRRNLCVIGVVGQIDGYDVIRRNSMLEIVDRARLIDASPKGGSEAEVMQLRYQLNSLRQLLSGFDIAVQKNPLQPPCTYLEEVRLSHEFQPGCGHEVAAALRNALKPESEGAKQ
ncbi:hypothetical protein [Stenotrophomonas nitritireducens]|uniref:Uncharacterized protein n=1 Tax=Stenotrophomonas nitritireducens TaxID=83617 RepID=A0ABR5NG36_9GAMM|nr:hypothetical protein [Stenotrophomonas nitritireducens]KRG54087.1 hypothetical protein ABB22_16835 [Stenotrophomonas nitritireducens]